MIPSALRACPSVRLDYERRENDRKWAYGKDAAVPSGESQYCALVGGGVLVGVEALFVFCRCVARQGSAEAYGDYDEVLHGFSGSLLKTRRRILVSRQ
jgi:hypothetical protein